MKKQNGFTGIEILVVFAVVSAVFGGMGYILKDEIAERFKKTNEEPKTEEPAPVANPFPAKPSLPLTELPKEPVVVDEQIGGTPIVQKPVVTATGEWLGRYTITAPEQCKGESGGWKAMLTETAGVIRGSFTTDDGSTGDVGGSATGSDVSWGVGGGGSGITFKGAISGNTMSGTFTSSVCEGSRSETNPNGIRSSGTYFGGRIVK